MDYLCLDFEGVLIPEIWQEVSKATGIEDLMLTTQDLESYEELMDIRLKLVSDNNISIHDILEIVEKMEPMDGAAGFYLGQEIIFRFPLFQILFMSYVGPWLEN